MAWTQLKNGKDKFLEKVPVYLEDQEGRKVPVVISSNGYEMKEKVSQYLGIRIDEDEEYRSSIKPWATLTITQPVRPLSINHTNMESIREDFLPVLKKLQSRQINDLINRFIGIGKRKFKELVKDNQNHVVLAFTGGISFVINTGRGIDPTDLTFNRFCALLGELNRDSFDDNGTAIVPSFAKNISIGCNIPASFKYFLHHGVYLSWDFTGENTRKNKQIYFAVKCMDLILINSNRRRLNQSILTTVHEMDREISTGDQTFCEDLMKFIGIDRLMMFEREQRKFIDGNSHKIFYTV